MSLRNRVAYVFNEGCIRIAYWHQNAQKRDWIRVSRFLLHTFAALNLAVELAREPVRGR